MLKRKPADDLNGELAIAVEIASFDPCGHPHHYPIERLPIPGDGANP